jgi:hypothetical protein
MQWVFVSASGALMGGGHSRGQALTTSMATFSGYLLWVLATKVQVGGSFRVSCGKRDARPVPAWDYGSSLAKVATGPK